MPYYGPLIACAVSMYAHFDYSKQRAKLGALAGKYYADLVSIKVGEELPHSALVQYINCTGKNGSSRYTMMLISKIVILALMCFTPIYTQINNALDKAAPILRAVAAQL